VNNNIYGEHVHPYINIAGDMPRDNHLLGSRTLKNVGSVLKPTHADLSPD